MGEAPSPETTRWDLASITKVSITALRSLRAGLSDLVIRAARR
jgi:hypothetical protein